ncbi:T9SS type A sorting domain-containing protein [Flavobacterium sp. CBA20B-1]|uniref:T9SS type A sorting domain-containing protein n=1 Tax=unclassified Flavobacterium TaxID=196869 RepID=UPI0022257E46|nr:MULTISPECIES: T9SS type A sorting domain-containing protein [unclassified Flavobacterium]WCM43034.1 T9SS type A sorting domain-containing protein [Flavobacterium sp. CBA20B-1]
MKLKLLFAFLIATISNAQTQIGQDIVGDMPDDRFGHGVALSADGNVMAVSAPGNDNNGTDAGHIRVYSKVSGTWTQIGQDIEGTIADDQIGHKIVLSDDGTTIAFPAVSAKRNTNGVFHWGYVSVYKNVNNTWTKVGQDIIDIGSNQFGLAISLSSDGSTIAISSPGAHSTFFENIQVYKNTVGSWQKIGGFVRLLNIENDNLSINYGFNVSLSGDGKVIAFTDIQGGINGGTNNSGILYVYKYQLGNWIKVGNTISTTNQNETLGFRVVLSNDGSILAVTTNNGGIGAVSVYKNVVNNWVQIGNDIVGEAALDACGQGLVMSANGNALAIGCTGCDTANGTDTGKVRIFENIQNNWVEKGSVIGANPGDGIGWSIALSKDGYNLAVGNPGNSSVGGKPYTTNFEELTFSDNLLQANNYQSKGTFPGSVRVFDLSGILSSDTFVLENFNIYPNPTTDILNIELKENLSLEKVFIYNTNGQLVKETSEKTINVSGFAKGIYNVQVLTNQGNATKKIIVQ